MISQWIHPIYLINLIISELKFHKFNISSRIGQSVCYFLVNFRFFHKSFEISRDRLDEDFKPHEANLCIKSSVKCIVIYYVLSLAFGGVDSNFSSLEGYVDRGPDHRAAPMLSFELGPSVPLPKPCPNETIVGVLNFKRADPASLKVSAPLHDDLPDKLRLPEIDLDPIFSEMFCGIAHALNPTSDVWLQHGLPAIAMLDVSAVWEFKILQPGFVQNALLLAFYHFCGILGRMPHWEPFLHCWYDIVIYVQSGCENLVKRTCEDKNY